MRNFGNLGISGVRGNGRGVARLAVAGLVGLGLAAGGCESTKATGAAAGGAGGAAAGAAAARRPGRRRRGVGALVGAGAGAIGGYLLGATQEMNTEQNREEAMRIARRSETNPATPQQALAADTADLNQDGFVTFDEVVAMSDAGLDAETIERRLAATDQAFYLNNDQRRLLLDKGVSRDVVNAMSSMTSYN